MIVEFKYQGIDFHIAVHKKLIDKSNKKTKAYRKYGLGAPWDAVSARIYKRNTFYALPELEDSLKYVPRGSTIIDCGAFIGNHTVFWNRLNDNKVIALEPLSENFILLEKNIDINNCTNCSLNKCLISDREGKFSCKTTSSRFAATQFVPDQSGIYRATTIDSIIDQDTDVSFIKIDVEGAEFSVLRGAKELIRRCHPILQVEIHAGVSVNSIMKYLSEFKYKMNKDVLFLGKHAKSKI